MHKILVVESLGSAAIDSDLGAVIQHKIEEARLRVEKLSVRSLALMPAAISMALDAAEYDAVIAVGASIDDGKIYTKEIFANCIRALMDLSTIYLISIFPAIELAKEEGDMKASLLAAVDEAIKGSCEMIQIQDTYNHFTGDINGRYKN